MNRWIQPSGLLYLARWATGRLLDVGGVTHHFGPVGHGHWWQVSLLAAVAAPKPLLHPWAYWCPQTPVAARPLPPLLDPLLGLLATSASTTGPLWIPCCLQTCCCQWPWKLPPSPRLDLACGPDPVCSPMWVWHPWFKLKGKVGARINGYKFKF